MPMPLPTFGARFGEVSLGRGQAPRATRWHRGGLPERALGVAMLAPMVLVLLLVVAYPLADSLWLSLHRVNLANPEQGQPFVGLGNYLHAFRQPAFWYSIHRTLYFTLLSVALELALGLLFAVLLNERFRGNLGARLAMIFPWALLTVSNGVLWAWILSPTYGVANALLVGLGVLQAPKAWLSDTFWTMHVVILADAWKMVPTMTLLLLAGLQPISHDLYEAAEVDGATRWQKFSRITLPLLRPATRWLLLLFSLGYPLLPIVGLSLSTIQTQASLLTLPVRIVPAEVPLRHYVDIFRPAAFGEASGQSTFVLALHNSLVVSVGATGVAMLLGTLAAYAFARFNIPRKRALLLIVLGSQLLPAVSLIIPLFRMFRGAGLLDTLLALILAYSTFGLPFVVWIMTGYFQSVPRELEEAARMDGASRFGAFIHVALPLAAPGLAATAIFTLLNAWDEFFFALIFTSTYASKTVPVALAEFIGRQSVNWGMLVTGGFIASLPPIILSLAFYRYVVAGLTAGGLKE